MEGEDSESDDERAFHKAAVWKRIIVVAAGATFKGSHSIDGVYANYPVFEVLNVKDVAVGISEKSGGLLVDKEQILEWNPDMIFFDAGNIWTVFDYEAQPNGVFRFSEFYKQIALAYGVGVRLDLSFFIFRVDFGVKLYDPSRMYGELYGTQWRTISNGLNWQEDMSFHFAIGYPF